MLETRKDIDLPGDECVFEPTTKQYRLKLQNPTK
jgi:hypothetical protein